MFLLFGSRDSGSFTAPGAAIYLVDDEAIGLAAPQEFQNLPKDRPATLGHRFVSSSQPVTRRSFLAAKAAMVFPLIDERDALALSPGRNPEIGEEPTFG